MADLPPEPPPRRCEGAGCGALLAYELVVSHGRGCWFPVRLCEGCTARAAAEERRERFDALFRGSGIPARYAGFTFGRTLAQGEGETPEAFAARLGACPRPTIGRTPWNTRVAALLRAFRPPAAPGSDAHGEPRSAASRSVYLSGPVGTGKTTLMVAALNGLMWEGVPVVYLPEAELYQRMRVTARAPHGARVDVDVVAVASRCWVLALDDLGTTEALKPWQRDALEAIVCARYDGNRPILATSNLELHATAPGSRTIAALHGERVASRLTEMCGRRMVRLEGWSWRTGGAAPASGAPAQTMLPLGRPPDES